MNRCPLSWIVPLILLALRLPLSAAEPSALDKAFTALQTYDWGQSHAALNPIDEAVLATRHDAAQRRQLEQRLVACLATPAPVAAKQFVCRKLSLIGTEASVPALTPLLVQPDLAHAARFALERIPGAAVDQALRAALPRVEDRLKIGLIGSLAAREDGAAVPALIGLLKTADPAIADATAQALGQIATPEAVQALRDFRAAPPPPLKTVATDAWIMAAERAARKGRTAEAAAVYRQLYAEQEAGCRLAGFRGLVATEPDRAAEHLRQALAGGDDGLRALAARLIAENGNAETINSFLGTLKTLPSAGQLALLDAVRGNLDATARPSVRAACRSDQPPVRLAALRALGLIGDASDVPLLLELAAAERGDETATARVALSLLPGKEVDTALTTILASAAPPLRAEAIRSLTSRGAAASVPRVADYLTDAAEPVRTQAWEAITAMGSAEQLPTVIRLLKAASDDRGREPALQALQAIMRRVRGAGRDSLLAGLEGADAASRLALLRALLLAGDAKSLAAVRVAAGDSQTELRDAAVRILADWPTTEAAPDLFALARGSDNPVWRTLAFRGYVRLARDSQAASQEKLRIITEAVKLATSDGDKRSVIAAAAELRDPAAAKLLSPFLDDATLTEEASVAVLKVAGTLDAKHADAVAPVLQRLLTTCKNPDLQKQARQHLERLGRKP